MSVMLAPVSNPHRRRGLTFALLAVFGFSASLPMTVLALRGLDPLLIGFGRAALPGLLALVVLKVAKVAWPGRQYLRPMITTALGVVLCWPILTALALRDITSAQAAVLAAGLPLGTAIFAVLRAGERPYREFWWAAIAGSVALIVFAISRGGGLATEWIPDLLMLAAVVGCSYGYAEGAVLTRVMPGWQMVSWLVVISLPITLPATIYFWVTTSPSPGVDAWVGFLYLALISQYLASFAWYRGLVDLGVARGGQVQQLQPLLTFGWAVLLLGETISPGTVAAALAVIGCVVLAQRARVRSAGQSTSDVTRRT